MRRFKLQPLIELISEWDAFKNNLRTNQWENKMAIIVLLNTLYTII